MSKEEFQKAVQEALRKSQYSEGRSDDEILDAMEECQDLIDDGYEQACGPDSFGFDWQINNLVWNISLCCF